MIVLYFRVGYGIASVASTLLFVVDALLFDADELCSLLGSFVVLASAPCAKFTQRLFEKSIAK